MPMKTGGKDIYSNLIEQSITMTAANTLTFAEINVGLTIFDKVALCINRVEYEVPDAAITELAASPDRWTIGISADSSISTLNYSTRALIDMCELQTIVSGTPASCTVIKLPLVKDFTNMPGGGILVAPKPLYLGLETAGYSAAAGGTMRMYFQVVQLKPDEYFELLESRRFFG